MGKRSFALVKEIMRKKLGRYPNGAELFEKCYFREDGSPTSAMVQEAIEQMKQLEGQQTENLDDNDGVHNRDDTFAKVMGANKHGHVCMYGMGVTPADIYGNVTSRDANYRMAMEYKDKYLQVHSYVVLKSLENINDIVASGYVNQIDSIRVNGEELGYEWCKVIVEYQMKRDVRLLKSYDHIHTIGDALGAPVAWPISLVAFDENND
ncbi:hypothetical protein Salat_2731000 [Sesamum alatum]|uniref:Transposase Tnp1/En/Spm-like domain-containing protein n=1 Tax=Sesamum alatum TaxID=300844 RepID=A0AAE1XJN0_9LAMI|nr:hypothetical protein Salat_2731000 [Sesamum alatum]